MSKAYMEEQEKKAAETAKSKEGNGNEPGSQNSNQTDPGNGQND